MNISKRGWKIGELATQTGLTVRTLHHYDQIGLLSPSMRSNADHRIYSEIDIAKLHHITSLKELGLSLEKIKEIIENPDFNPTELLKVQLNRVREQIKLQQQLYHRLELLYEAFNNQQDLHVEQFIKLIEVINMKEKYFTKEQLEKMNEQFNQLSTEERKQHENEWSDLVAKIRKEYEKGTSPENVEVKQLVKRWNEFINMVTGGETEIIKSAEHYYKENPEIAQQYGIDKPFYKYILKATSHI